MVSIMLGFKVEVLGRVQKSARRLWQMLHDIRIQRPDLNCKDCRMDTFSVVLRGSGVEALGSSVG